MPTITQAQNKAANIKFVEGFGIARQDAPRLSTVEAMLALYAEEFINLAKDTLEAKGKNNTSDLSDSMEFETTGTRTAFTMKLLVLDYYQFVDQGVRGRNSKYNVNTTSPFRYKSNSKQSTPSHAEAILKWLKEGRPKSRASDVKRYGAVGPTEKKSLTQQQVDMATAKRIAYFVKRKGLKRTGFWTDSFEKVFNDFAVQMSKALGVDVQVDLNQLVQGMKKKR